MNKDVKTKERTILEGVNIVIGVLNVISNMLFYAKSRKIHDPELPPELPGEFLKTFILPRFKLTEEQLSVQAGMSKQELSDVFTGVVKINKNIVDRLQPVLGEAANLLLYQQYSYDYYLTHKKWPPSPAPASPRLN